MCQVCVFINDEISQPRVQGCFNLCRERDKEESKRMLCCTIECMLCHVFGIFAYRLVTFQGLWTCVHTVGSCGFSPHFAVVSTHQKHL